MIMLVMYTNFIFSPEKDGVRECRFVFQVSPDESIRPGTKPSASGKYRIVPC